MPAPASTSATPNTARSCLDWIRPSSRRVILNWQNRTAGIGALPGPSALARRSPRLEGHDRSLPSLLRASTRTPLRRGHRQANTGSIQRPPLRVRQSSSDGTIIHVIHVGMPKYKPVDRIDGDRLCELLRRYDLGVRTTIRRRQRWKLSTTYSRSPNSSALTR